MLNVQGFFVDAFCVWDVGTGRARPYGDIHFQHRIRGKFHRKIILPVLKKATFVKVFTNEPHLNTK
jgi:hypothetical protein